MSMSLSKYIISIIWLNLILSMPSYGCEQLDDFEYPVLLLSTPFDPKETKANYVYNLLALILQKSNDKFGLCKVHLIGRKEVLKRLEMNLQHNTLIHVTPLTVTEQRDKRFIAVPIPIYKGLMGHRLFMVRRSEKDKFAQVDSIDDLKYFIAGQGLGWSDVDILKYNGMSVTTSGSIKTLIDMLAYGRFDYFPRGAHEIIKEFKTYPNDLVVLEPYLVLKYPSMTALYVNMNKPLLAKRLTYGFIKAVEDGSFDVFFNTQPRSVQAFAHLKNRKIIEICNPLLPAWVPLDKAEYWLTPWSMKIINKKCNVID